jgi:predicted metal-dependent hydrolase
MSRLLDKGIKFFNSGHYFEAHEVWEDLWRETSGDLRLFYQGLIQTAVGLYHLSRGNLVGARAQLSKAIPKLDERSGSATAIDAVALQRVLRKVLDELDVASPGQVRIARLKRKHDVVESEGTLE